MGLSNVALNLVKRSANYAKTFGKSSILETKAPNISSISGLKYSTNLKADTVQIATKVGKHKIPRYLYHMTSFENYQKILESGSLKCSTRHMPQGVYTLELDSFGKYWSKYLRNDLCGKMLDDSKKIVMLKIPTKNLEQSKLRIRTQYEVENGRCGRDAELEIRKWFNIAEMPKERKILLDNLLKKYDKKTALEKYTDMMPPKVFSLVKGYDAKMSSLFKQRKADLEFIYLDDIPMSEIEVVGSADCKKLFGDGLRDSFDARDHNIAKTVFENIFKSKPEENMLKAWRE